MLRDMHMRNILAENLINAFPSSTYVDLTQKDWVIPATLQHHLAMVPGPCHPIYGHGSNYCKEFPSKHT